MVGYIRRIFPVSPLAAPHYPPFVARQTAYASPYAEQQHNHALSGLHSAVSLATGGQSLAPIDRQLGDWLVCALTAIGDSVSAVNTGLLLTI